LASIEPVEVGGGFASVVGGDRAKVGGGFASVVGGATVIDVEICG
jgi:hypothetical protein